MSGTYEIQEWVPINRDPFARETLVRRLVHDKDKTCDWDGRRRENYRGQPLPLFQYGIERDGSSSVTPIKGVFCCASCYRSYHAN